MEFLETVIVEHPHAKVQVTEFNKVYSRKPYDSSVSSSWCDGGFWGVCFAFKYKEMQKYSCLAAELCFVF